MSPWLLFVLMSLACFRLTRLVVRDDFPPIYWLRSKIKYARPPRLKAVKKYVGNKWVVDHEESEWELWSIGELVSCHWCSSAYLSGGIVAWVWALDGLPLPLLWWVGVWGVGATLAAKIG